MKIAIIPARGGSRRIKDRNIGEFCGRPMISYALEAAKDSGLFSFSPASHILDPNLVVTDRLLPYALPRYKAADIDEPEDLEYAEILYRGLRATREARRQDEAPPKSGKPESPI